jgi:penicillin-binding protein 2
VLQVRDREFNSELAERNRIKTVPLLAPRGKSSTATDASSSTITLRFTLMLSRETLKPEHIPAIAAGLHLDSRRDRISLKRDEPPQKYFPARSSRS